MQECTWSERGLLDAIREHPAGGLVAVRLFANNDWSVFNPKVSEEMLSAALSPSPAVEALTPPLPSDALRAALEQAEKALKETRDAINEMFRYFDGGETRGSYDGKPERAQLRKAGYAATATLNALAALTRPSLEARAVRVEREYEITCPDCCGEGRVEHPHLGGAPSYMAESPPDPVTVDCEECNGTGKKWTDDPCRLDECPPGLFEHGGMIGFKSEYYSKPGQPDAYCVESGEYFWGGTSDIGIRAALLVQPIRALSAADVEGKRG